MEPTADLAPALLRDEAALAAAAEDFGHLIVRRPAAVARPGSPDDVVAALGWARQHGLRVAAQGRRHSVYGRAQAPDGLVLDLGGLDTVPSPGDDRISVGAGATWRAVLAATLPRGRTPPVLPDHLDISVGGTVVVGGIGGTTSRWGAVSDTVLDLDVVTAAGQRLRCSRTEEPELFDAVRAGLGQVAVVVGVGLALVPAPRRVRRVVLECADLPTMLADQRRLVADGRFESVKGAIVPDPAGGWSFRVDVATWQPDAPAELPGRPVVEDETVPYADHLDRLSVLEAALRRAGRWELPHPWLTTFVGDAAVEEVVGAELAGLPPADLGPFGQVVLSPIRRAAVATPLLRLPPDELGHAFNLIRFPATADGAERLVRANRATYERVRSAGGTLYPVAAVPMGAADWRAHFGPERHRLAEAGQRHDPDRLLTPGYPVLGA